MLTLGASRRTRGLVSWEGQALCARRLWDTGPCRPQGMPGARSLLSPPPPWWSCPDSLPGTAP